MSYRLTSFNLCCIEFYALACYPFMLTGLGEEMRIAFQNERFRLTIGRRCVFISESELWNELRTKQSPDKTYLLSGLVKYGLFREVLAKVTDKVEEESPNLPKIELKTKLLDSSTKLLLSLAKAVVFHSNGNILITNADILNSFGKRHSFSSIDWKRIETIVKRINHLLSRDELPNHRASDILERIKDIYEDLDDNRPPLQIADYSRLESSHQYHGKMSRDDI